MEKEQEIRLIAYYIWEEDGRKHGYDIEHWLKAKSIWEESLMLESPTGTASKETVSTTKKHEATAARRKRTGRK